MICDGMIYIVEMWPRLSEEFDMPLGSPLKWVVSKFVTSVSRTSVIFLGSFVILFDCIAVRVMTVISSLS